MKFGEKKHRSAVTCGLIFSAIAACLLAACVASGLAASAPQAGLPQLPDDLRYEFKYVPPTENAIVNWQRAGEVLANLAADDNRALSYCWTVGAKEPAVEEAERLNNWLQRNQEALRLLSESLQKPSAQWPIRKPQDPIPEVMGFSRIMRARLLEADQLAAQGKCASASQILEGNLKLVRIGLEADARSLQYLLCNSARTLTQNAILRLASRQDVPATLLKGLLANLPCLADETNIYSKVLSAECVRDHDADLDARHLAAVWSKYAETNRASLLLSDDMVRPFRVLVDPSLVVLHPKPFDLAEGLEKGIRHYRIYRTNCLGSWSARNKAVTEEREADREKLLADIAPLMAVVEDEALPLSQAAAQRARAAYLQIDNPVGRALVPVLEYLDDSDIPVFRARTEREAVRTLLALLIFQREKGRLPAKLSDLVEADILDSVPMDFFANVPLHYDRQRRIVWSVGENGIDDGGKGGKFLWLGDDAVWNIPELN